MAISPDCLLVQQIKKVLKFKWIRTIKVKRIYKCCYWWPIFISECKYDFFLDIGKHVYVFKNVSIHLFNNNDCNINMHFSFDVFMQ